MNIHVLMCQLNNWGDTLNKELIPLLSGKEIIPMNKQGLNEFEKCSNETVYSCVGSILGWATPQVEVWGSGFISNTTTITSIKPPKKIHAVRGPKTRALLINNGIDCPEVFGDPALLMPKFYNPTLPKLHDLSVIPHQIDKPLIPQLKKAFPSAHFIDIQQPIYKFINEVIQSKFIISSALHGCICAYAYNVPYAHRKFSEKVLGKNFKFQDFEESKPYIDLDKLMDVCPFKKDSL